MRQQSIAIHCGLTAAVVLLSAMVQPAKALEPVDGFLTPFRTIRVATAETGILRDICVLQGDEVRPGQILARLDDELYSSLLAIAQHGMDATGRLKAAETEHRIREQRLSKLQDLIRQGSARPEEVERAAADAEIASAQLRAIREDLAIKQLEYQRARTQLERRIIRAPTHGVVLRLDKEPGEFIGQNDPHVMVIVQLDVLRAVFAVPNIRARHLQIGHTVKVRLPELDLTAEGTVESVSPVVDGKSGTMRIDVRLNNPERRFLSGEPCSLLIDDAAVHHGKSDLTTPDTSRPAGTPSADRRMGGTTVVSGKTNQERPVAKMPNKTSQSGQDGSQRNARHD